MKVGEGEDEDGTVGFSSLLEALDPGIKDHSLERSHETGLRRSPRHQC